MSWDKVKLSKVLKQYRVTHIVQNDRDYKQVTISKHDGVKFRGIKNGKEIGRKRQFIIDLKNYPNTLMFVRQGVYEGAIGIAPTEVDGCIATENMPMFSIEGINIDYLNLIIQSPYFKEELEKIPTTGSAQKSIHERQILEIEIPLPSPDIQNLLVESFKKNQLGINEISTELTHQLDLVKQLRQAFLREAMQGKLVPQDPIDEPASVLLEKIKAEKERLVKEKKIKKQKPLPPINEDEIPFEIPENWVWCRLGDLVLSFQNGISSRGTSIGDKITVLRLADITNKFVDLSDRREITLKKNDYERYLLDESDLLITRVNGSLDLVGNFNYVGKHDIPIAACDHFVRMTLAKVINSSFIFLSGKMDHLRRNIEDNFKTTSGQKTVNQGHLSALLIALPPNFEQQRIIAKLDELMQYCDELEASIKESKQQNELLLQQVLREALEPATK